MESTGEAGRIHVSARIASTLEAGGGHRLTARAGPVDVKGKGPMETFWLDGPAPGNERCGDAATAAVLAEARRLLAASGGLKEYPGLLFRPPAAAAAAAQAAADVGAAAQAAEAAAEAAATRAAEALEAHQRSLCGR